jgi:hypothetical protein
MASKIVFANIPLVTNGENVGTLKPSKAVLWYPLLY